MSNKRAVSPTLSFDDDDGNNESTPPERQQQRARKMTPAEARNLPESQIFRMMGGNLGHDATSYLLEYVTTLGIMESATVRKSFVTELLYTDEFWKKRWIMDFTDHAREIGSEIPKWCRENTGDGIELYPIAEETRPAWDVKGGFLPWKKYWLWTWFFRRSLTRIFAELFNQKAAQTMHNTARFLRQAPYTFVLEPRSSSNVVVSRAGVADKPFILSMRQLVSLSQGYRDVSLWGNVTLKARLQAAVSDLGPDVSLPLAAAFMSSNIIDQMTYSYYLVNVPIGKNRGVQTRYRISLQRTQEKSGGFRLDRDRLAQNYLNWYVYKMLQNNFPLRRGETAESTGRSDTPLVLLIKKTMPHLVRAYHVLWDLPGQEGTPQTDWFLQLSDLLNAPRVRGVIAWGDHEADANRGKIFLGSEICSHCNETIEKEKLARCKLCKVYFCGQKCFNGANHLIECDFKKPYPRPTMFISNWTYKEWANRLRRVTGSKGAAIQKAKGKVARTDEEREFWWWVVHELKAMFD